MRGVTMKRFIPGIALLVGALAISGQASAHGGGWYGPGPVIGAAVVGAWSGRPYRAATTAPSTSNASRPTIHRHRSMYRRRHRRCITSPTWSSAMCPPRRRSTAAITARRRCTTARRAGKRHS
ncbi:exported hypothetical protein [Pseudomonas soli]